MKMIDFTITSDSSSTEFQDAMELYSEAFPDNERQPLAKIKYRVEHGYYSLIMAKINWSVAGFSLLCPFTDSNFGLLDYIAIQKEQRGLGVGSKLFNKTWECFQQISPSSFLVLEVEDPAFSSPSERVMCLRRVRFYQELGAKIVTNFRYLMPPMAGNSATNMLLMVYTGNNRVALNSQILANIVTQLYSKVYERYDDDPYLGQMLKNLPDNIVLI